MICQECEEEYQLEGLRFDPKSCRIFGAFRCGCRVKLVLPEEDFQRLGLLDDDAREQLRHLRMLSFRFKLDNERKPGKIYLKALKAHRDILLKYLGDASEKS
jgi:hypothetical protein